MDILAWGIIACFVSFVAIPAFALWISGDHFISYKDAWIGGHGIVLFLVSFAAILFGVVWAFEKVVW